MQLNKLGAVILMLGMLVGFLLLMPIIIDSTTAASTQAALTGDDATVSTLNIFPLLASLGCIGVTLFFVASVWRS